ncbi:hypothetical protein [Marinagarivorans algicola]|uniref:hypothetical protein n=1 Tax=Marinagarivorans algicola TaxID=1513270 RepID=UPI0012E18BBE|nr:hypothetical protein [Marinagarivorans algicola]
MFSNQYSDTRGDGFVLSKRDKDTLAGRYITKCIVVHNVVDPFGSTQRYERLEYAIVNFSIISDDPPIIRLIDPPRKLKPFVNAMTAVCGLGFSMTPVTIDLLKVVAHLESSIGRAKVSHIECGGINVSNIATAAVTFNSESDARIGLSEFIGGVFFNVNRIKAAINGVDFHGKVDAKRNGTITYDGFPDGFMVPILIELVKSSLVRR